MCGMMFDCSEPNFLIEMLLNRATNHQTLKSISTHTTYRRTWNQSLISTGPLNFYGP